MKASNFMNQFYNEKALRADMKSGLEFSVSVLNGEMCLYYYYYTLSSNILCLSWSFKTHMHLSTVYGFKHNLIFCIKLWFTSHLCVVCLSSEEHRNKSHLGPSHDIQLKIIWAKCSYSNSNQILMWFKGKCDLFLTWSNGKRWIKHVVYFVTLTTFLCKYKLLNWAGMDKLNQRTEQK